MPVCKNCKLVPTWLLAAILLAAAPATPADGFKVTGVQARIENGQLLAAASLDLDPSNEAETALNKGIPLDVIVELALYRQRWLIWNKQLAEWELRTEIRYHALSGQYVVSLPGASEAKSFSSLQAALKYMGDLSRLALPLPPDLNLEADAQHVLAVRARLDVEALPAPLRPVAYTSSAWRLKSGWTKWPIQP